MCQLIVIRWRWIRSGCFGACMRLHVCSPASREVQLGVVQQQVQSPLRCARGKIRAAPATVSQSRVVVTFNRSGWFSFAFGQQRLVIASL